MQGKLSGSMKNGQRSVSPTSSESQSLLDERDRLTSREEMAHRVDRGYQALVEGVEGELKTLLNEIDYHLTRPSQMPHRIERCRRALELVKRESQPELWALFHSKLATSLAQNPLDDRAENIEQAIPHFQQALLVFTRDAFPQQWVMMHYNLGHAYYDRRKGEKAENIEQAISHYHKLLEINLRHASPQLWAMTQHNLGVNLWYRIRGDRAENIERAIGHYQQVLQVYTRQAFAYEWARMQYNLGNAYRKRVRGDKGKNIEQAIEHYQQSLEVYGRHAYPKEWAMTQNSLGNAYSTRIKGERAENTEQAFLHFKQALEVRTRDIFPDDWAMSQNNLAIAYQNRIKGVRTENIEQAIFHLKQTLLVYTRDTLPELWARTQMNLGGAYNLLHISGELPDNIEAIHYYQQALEVYTPQAFPQDCRDTAYALGRLLYDEKRLSEARQAFETAHQAVEALRGEVPREGGKKKLASENADLYARLVHCCLHDANADEKAAFEYAAAGKGRAFVDTLASGGFNILTAIDSNPTLANDSLLQQYRSLTQQIDNLRLTLNREDVSDDEKKRLRPELEARLSEYDGLWEDLTFKYPNLTATVTAPSLTAAQAMMLAADLQATLVEYVEHAGGWSAFVVTQDTIQHIPLNSIDEQLLPKTNEWIKNIEKRKKVYFNPKTSRKRLTQLYTALIAPLQEHLPPASQGKRLIIAPFRTLHQLPLNVAQNPDSDRYLSQAYTLTFTPSLAALRVSLDMARQANWSFQRPKNAIHIAHPGHQEMRNRLQKSQKSAAEMSKIFPDLAQLDEKEATPDAVAEQVANRDLIHFYCHGIFEKDNPNQSGLLLHDGFLTVQRIITDLNLSHTHLTALAACETGRVGVTQGEELVGLIQALLTSGSKAVVATLWKVDETPTQAFFQHFYRAIKDGHLPAEALTLATQAIRQTKSWEHPYYWAAFQVSGLGFSH